MARWIPLLLSAAVGLLLAREWERYQAAVAAERRQLIEQVAEQAAAIGVKIGYEYGRKEGEQIGIMKAEEFRYSKN